MHTFIIVDDDEDVRNGFKDLLNWESLGFQILGSAADGREALNLIKTKSPKVVVTDIVMPEMDGIELAKQIRELDSQTKIVMVSAYDEFKYAQKAILYGVSGYLLKPFDEEELRDIFLRIARTLDCPDNIKTVELPLETGGNIQEDADNIILKVRKYVQKFYDQKMTLEDIAGYLYLTPSYFSVLYKKETGENFIDYVTSVRVNKAKEFLTKSCFKVKDISYRVGYEDYTYFCKIFKKNTGMTPLEFRACNVINGDKK